jgi:hypothetical protein
MGALGVVWCTGWEFWEEDVGRRLDAEEGPE